tara:strand:- start:352 stop:567 length:216 start_codon:yes stop_codon:yes gene_type:complete
MQGYAAQNVIRSSSSASSSTINGVKGCFTLFFDIMGILNDFMETHLFDDNHHFDPLPKTPGQSKLTTPSRT